MSSNPPADAAPATLADGVAAVAAAALVGLDRRPADYDLAGIAADLIGTYGLDVLKPFHVTTEQFLAAADRNRRPNAGGVAFEDLVVGDPATDRLAAAAGGDAG